MYFNLIEPAEGQERAAAFARLDGPYAEHQWLWRYFPALSGTPRDFLFRRMDASGSRFYVVSAREPVAVDTAWSVRSRLYAPELHAGQQMRFDLRVNPVVTTLREGKRRRDDVVMNRKKQLLAERGLVKWANWKTEDKPAEYDLVGDTCNAWLCDSINGRPSRAERAGFNVLDGSLRADAYQQHRTGKKGAQFSTVDLSGELEVADPVAFLATLQNGLGHGKAFGCGLLLVRSI